jgi:hypothetical protein
VRIPPMWLDGVDEARGKVHNRVVHGTGHDGDWFSYDGHHTSMGRPIYEKEL